MSNSNVEVTTQEAALSTSSFTPEQLAEAAKILVSQQQEAAEVAVEAVSPINQQKKAELIASFNELIENPKYWENENRIKKLEDALKLPKFDDRSLQQFYVSAREELIRTAMEYAIRNNTVPVMPTEEEIEELAKQKKAAKEAKDAKKAAKKNS